MRDARHRLAADGILLHSGNRLGPQYVGGAALISF
jgi:hypothetical protein